MADETVAIQDGEALQERGRAEVAAAERNLTETAKFFGVSVPTVREWIGRGCPVVDEGGRGVGYVLDLRQVKAWRDGELADQARARAEKEAHDKQLAMELFGEDLLAPEGAGGGGMSPRQVRELADAQKHLMLVEQQRGRLVKAEDVAVAVSAAFRRLADRLRVLPDDLQRDHGLDPELGAVVAEAIDDALNDLADELERDGGAENLTGGGGHGIAA